MQKEKNQELSVFHQIKKNKKCFSQIEEIMDGIQIQRRKEKEQPEN